MDTFAGVMSKAQISTRAEGEMVVLTINNAEIRLHYQDAFRISQWLRVSGKEAKANAGDVSRHWSIIAQLDDANAR
jgi:hypothetical protein